MGEHHYCNLYPYITENYVIHGNSRFSGAPLPLFRVTTKRPSPKADGIGPTGNLPGEPRRRIRVYPTEATSCDCCRRWKPVYRRSFQDIPVDIQQHYRSIVGEDSCRHTEMFRHCRRFLTAHRDVSGCYIIGAKPEI